MIVFRKKNDVYLECVEGDRGDLRTLSDYFTFEVPGAKFSPAYKNRMWDGKIRLFNLKTNLIYFGLYKDIIEFSKIMDIDVQFEGNRFDFPGMENTLDKPFVDGFLQALNPHSKGEPIEMRDYQKEAFYEVLKNQRQLILSPTASGKSLIIYSLMRWYREVHDNKILIVVPSISLVSQLYGDFRDYSNNTFTDAHCITGGVVKDTDKRVVITTWQSIFKQPLPWFAQFSSVIVDEVHHATAKSIQGIMDKLLLCPDRVGFTGTLHDAKTGILTLKGLFGPVKKVITTKELIERDQVSQMSIKLLQFNYNDIDRKTVSGLNYQEELKFLIEHQRRNEIIAKMGATLPGNTLIVFSRLDHGKSILELVGEPEDKMVFYVAGETDKDTREMTRQLVESNNSLIIASLGVFSTGINIKNLHNLIFAHPTKSKIKVLQSIGRVLRKAEDGKPAIVYDIIDDLKHKTRDNFALRHAAERFKHYTDEKFDYKIITIDL